MMTHTSLTIRLFVATVGFAALTACGTAPTATEAKVADDTAAAAPQKNAGDLLTGDSGTNDAASFKGYDAACEFDTECESGLCERPTPSSAKICRQTCDSSQECVRDAHPTAMCGGDRFCIANDTCAGETTSSYNVWPGDCGSAQGGVTTRIPCADGKPETPSEACLAAICESSIYQTNHPVMHDDDPEVARLNQNLAAACPPLNY